MRELKFRAWVYYGERLRKPRYSDDDWLCRFFEDCKEDDTDENGNPQCIEQYTGLKDKNGKEIYEGDIVKLTGKVAQNKSTLYKVVWDSFLAGFDLISLEPNKTDVGYLNETETENRYEVIGNIHENPELIEKEKE